MSRGDVALLIGWCVLVFFGYWFLEFPMNTALFAVVIGGAVFALRLYLARRTFRR